MVNKAFPTTLPVGSSYTDAGPEKIGNRFRPSVDTVVDGFYIKSPVAQSNIVVEIMRLYDLSGTASLVPGTVRRTVNLVQGDNFIPFLGGPVTLLASMSQGYMTTMYHATELHYYATPTSSPTVEGSFTMPADSGGYTGDMESYPGHNTPSWYGLGIYQVENANTPVVTPLSVTPVTPVSVVTPNQATLQATANDGDGTKTFTWSQISGSPVSITDASIVGGSGSTQSSGTSVSVTSQSATSSAKVTPTVAGAYVFRVTVTDSSGTVTADISVTATAPTTTPPVTTPPAGATDSYELWVKDEAGTYHKISSGASAVDESFVFRPEKYGAKGDGKLVTLATVTANSKTLTASGAAFTSADVGKSIIVTDAGPGGALNPSKSLITKIQAVNSATSITLVTAASVGNTKASVLYGTDDSAAFLTMMDAANDYALTSDQRHAVVKLLLKTYVLATKPTADTNGSLKRYSRAQVPLAYNPSTTGRKAVIEIQGPGVDGATFTSWHQEVPQVSGAVIFSMIEVTQADYMAKYPIAVIGGPPNVNDPWGNEPNIFNNVLAVVDGVRVMCPHDPGQIAIDMFSMAQYHIGTVSADVFAAPHGLTGAYMKPTNTEGCGFRTNYTGFNDRSTITAILIQGYWIGMTVDEHMAVSDCQVIYSQYGLYLNLPSGGTVQHGAWFGYASVEISEYPLYVASDYAYFGLVIDMLDNEGSVTEHIHDPKNVLRGQVNLFPSGSAPSGPITAIINGAQNLRVYNLAGVGAGYIGPASH